MAERFKRYKPHGRSRTGPGPRPLGQALDGLLDRLDAKGARRLSRLWRSWNELLGADMAGLMQPLGHRGGSLLVHTHDPAVAQEALFLAPLVLERVNAFLGEEVFDKIGFELLNGRVPLTENAGPQTETWAAPALPRPRQLGRLLQRLPAHTALGRCYRAYLRMIEQDHGPTGPGGRG